MNEIQNVRTDEIDAVQSYDVSVSNRLEIIEEGIRKNYLARLTEMKIAPVGELMSIEDDLIENVRLYHISEMVYQKGEPALDKFTTVFNSLSTYNASVFVILDSDGKTTDFYLGVRNNESNEDIKRSTVTLGDTLKNTLIGNFPGIKIENKNRSEIKALSSSISELNNVTSVSVVGNKKADKDKAGNFVQGIEKLALAMQGRSYIGIVIAQNQSSQAIQMMRRDYQELYTRLSPLQKVQTTRNESESTSRSKSFKEMNGKQKAAMLGSALISVAGVVGGVAIGTLLVPGAGAAASASIAKSLGAQIGGQVGGQLSSFITSLAPHESMTQTTSDSSTLTIENKKVTDLLALIDESLKRTKEFDSYGMWNVAGYFASDDMSTAEIAASNYRSLMNGENSGREVSAINSWRSNDVNLEGDFDDLITYLSRFAHPKFCYGYTDETMVLVDASTAISGKELGLHLGLPRATVSGLPVIEHAEYGKEVTTYQLFSQKKELRPEERITLGRIFDLGQITDKIVELDNKSLNMHTFITGSTGSGKSNTVYQLLTELNQDGIPFLVVEPAKGEYKDVFGNWGDVNVLSTNPNIAELIKINPFKFPESIHVLEHIDGLVEIFSVCWPMYDAMPAFFKDAILKSYEAVGWDLGSSTFESDEVEYPDFEILVEQLELLIESSDYASDIKSNYRGALITRVKSLTVGLNKFIFTTAQTPYSRLFDENCIVDISRVKSTEVKALIMGLIVYILNEYRVDQKSGNNNGLKHVTVLEEAHNLLKNTLSGGESELIGKSVEMLTNTIAEIRTFGEGFIIVDQSPSSVDIAAIKNTNTKIVLRTPEANDREAVGRSMGLTEDQVNEIAKLPSGVAVVYQNNWVNPVLTLINKADVEETKYEYFNKIKVRTQKSARISLVKMLLQPWLNTKYIPEKALRESLSVLEMPRKQKQLVERYIDEYSLLSGHLEWDESELHELQQILLSIMNVSLLQISQISDVNELRQLVKNKFDKINEQCIECVCYIITITEGVQE